jgi:hypothetical protein
MDRCPICRATLNGAETCRRCRAELGSVIRTERMAEQLRTMAMHRFMSGDPTAADRLLKRSALLHRTPATLSLQRLIRR